MARRSAPLLVLVAVSLAVFGLAKWHPFSPTVPAAVTALPAGNAVRGAAIFATSCAGCHGSEATGGVGPALRGSGLTAGEVAAVVASGRGVMPAGIVTGQDAADVAAHVASIAK
jgi:mono/diheme cytochrome c family protein